MPNTLDFESGGLVNRAFATFLLSFVDLGALNAAPKSNAGSALLGSTLSVFTRSPA